MKNAILGVVGWSGSGKTTLLEFLVTQLVAHGKTVNVVKHSHHDVILEPAHKDSARLRNAGANQVLLASPYRYAIVHELRAAPEPTLEELLSQLSSADLTLVEGYKWAAIPKLEVHRPSLGKPAIYLEDQNIIAIATDAGKLEDKPETLMQLDLNDQDSVLAWVLGAMEAGVLMVIEKA